MKELNILLILFAVLAVWRGISGMKRGITEEMHRLMMLVLSLFVIAVGIHLYSSIQEKDTKNIVISAAVILITGLAVKLVNLVMKSLEAIAHLPFISLANGCLGMAAGILEAIVFLWILYFVIGEFDTGAFGEAVMEWTQNSVLLQKIYRWNILSPMISKII